MPFHLEFKPLAMKRTGRSGTGGGASRVLASSLPVQCGSGEGPHLQGPPHSCSEAVAAMPSYHFLNSDTQKALGSKIHKQKGAVSCLKYTNLHWELPVRQPSGQEQPDSMTDRPAVMGDFI